MKYCIRWTSKLTGVTGRGGALLSRSEAEEWVKQLNSEYDDIYHEVIGVGDKEK